MFAVHSEYAADVKNVCACVSVCVCMRPCTRSLVSTFLLVCVRDSFPLKMLIPPRPVVVMLTPAVSAPGRRRHIGVNEKPS